MNSIFNILTNTKYLIVQLRFKKYEQSHAKTIDHRFPGLSCMARCKITFEGVS
jgi:hypothetical protein